MKWFKNLKVWSMDILIKLVILSWHLVAIDFFVKTFLSFRGDWGMLCEM